MNSRKRSNQAVYSDVLELVVSGEASEGFLDDDLEGGGGSSFITLLSNLVANADTPFDISRYSHGLDVLRPSAAGYFRARSYYDACYSDYLLLWFY